MLNHFISVWLVWDAFYPGHLLGMGRQRNVFNWQQSKPERFPTQNNQYPYSHLFVVCRQRLIRDFIFWGSGWACECLLSRWWFPFSKENSTLASDLRKENCIYKLDILITVMVDDNMLKASNFLPLLKRLWVNNICLWQCTNVLAWQANLWHQMYRLGCSPNQQLSFKLLLFIKKKVF